MSLVICSDCDNKISDKAQSCPHCGNPSVITKKINKVTYPLKQQKISILLVLGIFVMPYIFSWLTLNKGYSKKARIVSFSWLVLMVFSVLLPNNEQETQTNITRSVSKPKINQGPSYAQVDAQVGCKSKYSENKKEDIFKNNYANRWHVWTGEIVSAESGEVRLNIDGFGSSDLSVNFKNPTAGYDLIVGSKITVKFVMKYVGGCFLPFRGDEAIVIN
ncbi:MAG: hypothetical protein ACI9YE_002520 [Psychroserpens sp.]|jgi:hypothetical protein